MNVLIFDQQDDLPINEESVRHAVKRTLSLKHCHADEVSVYFVSVDEISRLHQEFFDDPTPTDCISFPYDKEKVGGFQHLGEVFVCPKIAIEYVLKLSEEINEDRYREITLYVIHGLLHLLGYDDIEEKDQKAMRAEENLVMQDLIEKNLLISA